MELENEADMAVAEVGEGFLTEGGRVDGIDTYTALVGAVEGAYDLQEGGLAGTRWADDADNLATVDVEVDAFEDLEGAEALGDSLGCYHCYGSYGAFWDFWGYWGYWGL